MAQVILFSDPAVDFEQAYELQKRLVELRSEDRICDTFLFLQHNNCVTVGRGDQRRSEASLTDGFLPLKTRAIPTRPTLLSQDYKFFEIERGGGFTAHEPGQLVCYPIVKLDGSDFGPNRDLKQFLNLILGGFRSAVFYLSDVETESREGATGLWVVGEQKKLGSLGIAVRKWVTYHGFSLNLFNSLLGFQAISPCGFSAEVMTSLDHLCSTWVMKAQELEKQSKFWPRGFHSIPSEELNRPGFYGAVQASIRGLGLVNSPIWITPMIDFEASLSSYL